MICQRVAGRKGLFRGQSWGAREWGVGLLKSCVPTWDVPWVSRAVCGRQGWDRCEDVSQVQDGGLWREESAVAQRWVGRRGRGGLTRSQLTPLLSSLHRHLLMTPHL